MDANIKPEKKNEFEKDEVTLAEQAQHVFGPLERRAGPFGCRGTYRIGVISLFLKYFGTSQAEIAKTE